ncbi:selenoprotein F [Dermatophagoides farinae]|uniref:selenoprotein F n=1 Tax=Dermatophagoides farinae TaxID=6954 RepID=UPI001F0EED65|nr:selenoprotein F-like [Dermatophagoides farinae]
MNPMYLFGCFMSVIITSIVGEKLTDNECNQLGYNPAELFCSRCLELTKFELDNLKDSCMKCCRQDDDSNSKKYSFARLEYCECNIANFPQIKAFIRGDKSKKYSNLKIKFVRGILPILKLLNEHHDVVDELNIQKWDTDTIEEFLDQHLLS